MLSAAVSYSQTQTNFSTKERGYYNNLSQLCRYLEQNSNNLNNKDAVVRKWIYLDYILNDTSEARKEMRIVQLAQLLRGFKHFIDSVGLENLDACPIRNYKNSRVFFKPFAENLADHVPFTFAYYNKHDPKHPMGYLLFDNKTKKLISWILINQGGIYYFLTFNSM